MICGWKFNLQPEDENEPNKALEPTIMAVTDCAPSSTLRASHDRGSVCALGKMKAPELLQEVSVAGRFKISTPKGSTHELVENGTTLAFRLRADCEPLYLKRYDLPDGFSSIESALEAEAKRFLKEGILSVREVAGSDIDRGEVNEALYAQLVATISDSHWWIARFVAKPGSKSYFLLHCHGDKDYLLLAISMFCEFYILE